MKFDFDLDLTITESPKDGQVNVKLSKADEVRFKMQKAKHDKRLNEWTRALILQLIDRLEQQEDRAS